MRTGPPDDREAPASRFDPRVGRVFAWIAERMLRRSFAAVRLESGSRPELEALRAHAGPIVLLLHHPSWWDPLIVAFLRRRCFGDRSVIGAMDAHELARFGIFRRLGVIGVDPDDPASARRLLSEVARRWRCEPRALCAITPQGRLVDPRAPVDARPGAAMLLDGHPEAMAAVVALEYPFWSSRRPEALIRIRRLPAPASGGARGWHRAMIEAMERGRVELATAAIARDERAFETLVAGSRGGGLYAWWQRLTGRGSEIDARRRAPPATRPARPEAPA